MSKLAIDITGENTDTVMINVIHEGSCRAGEYLGVYTDGKVTFENISPLRFPVKVVTHDCHTLTDAVETIIDYFERHGCF